MQFKSLSFRRQLLLGFLTVIIITGLISTVVGTSLLHKSLAPRIQDKLRLDLNRARDAYKEYLSGILQTLDEISQSNDLQKALQSSAEKTDALRLDELRSRFDLDFLSATDLSGRVIARSDSSRSGGGTQVARSVSWVLSTKRSIVSTEEWSQSDLDKEHAGLSARVRVPLELSKARPPDSLQDSGVLVVVAVVPIVTSTGVLQGVLYGGRVLNNDTVLVDRLRTRLYPRPDQRRATGKALYGFFSRFESRPDTALRSVGVVSIFLRNHRIATTLSTQRKTRAVETVVSDKIFTTIETGGNIWLKEAFGSIDWYLTAYEPLENYFGKTIGMLGIGVLESQYSIVQSDSLTIFLAATIAGVLLSVLCWYFLVNAIMRPVNSLLRATQTIAEGNYDKKVTVDNASPEITALCNSFNLMTASIKERDERLSRQAQEEVMRADRLAMIGRLAAGVAHEINNPLGSILLFSRLSLQKAPAEGILRENLERIEKDTKRCQNIVQGLLDFARQREPKRESVNCNDKVEKTLRLLVNQPLFHNVDLVKQFQTDLPIISADPGQLLQVFVNIIVNAVDAMQGKGILTIGTRSMGTNVEISFSDTGCGIPPEMLDRIFEPFYTTKTVGQGTGLGLSISHGIILQHGGSIKVFSRVGEGTTFVVVLPLGGPSL